jgi:hypothetical protein
MGWVMPAGALCGAPPGPGNVQDKPTLEAGRGAANAGLPQNRE